MPASPVTEEQLYSDSDECCQIQQPTTEYSKLLGKPITLRKRLKAFRSAVDHVIKFNPKTTFNVCDLRSTHPDTPTALVADGLAIEIMVTTNESRTTLQVDLHEEWRQIMTGSSFVPDNVEVLLGPNGFKTHLIIASGTHTFDTAKCGTVMSLKLKKAQCRTQQSLNLQTVELSNEKHCGVCRQMVSCGLSLLHRQFLFWPRFVLLEAGLV